MTLRRLTRVRFTYPGHTVPLHQLQQRQLRIQTALRE